MLVLKRLVGERVVVGDDVYVTVVSVFGSVARVRFEGVDGPAFTVPMHVNSRVVIDADTSVMVTEIVTDGAKLGFDARPDVRVDREEVRLRMARPG